MQRLVAAGVLLAVVGLVRPAVAAENPTGTWKWSVTFNNNTREQTLKLKAEGEKLTGSMLGRNNQETPIENGTFKDDKVSFTVTREFNNQKFTQKYNGTVKGDTITGKVESERNGQAQSRDWEAKREK
jgi:hypothetical protein